MNKVPCIFRQPALAITSYLNQKIASIRELLLKTFPQFKSRFIRYQIETIWQIISPMIDI